ncbi:hypothetical protein BH24ACT9_BH24ACT9_10830 [soil metagenome]
MGVRVPVAAKRTAGKDCAGDLGLAEIRVAASTDVGFRIEPGTSGDKTV